eukprot:14358411-Heterocapsa_arctica.AAC.1
MIFTRGDVHWQANDMNIADLFTGDIHGLNPFIRSTHMVGPEPPLGTAPTCLRPRWSYIRDRVPAPLLALAWIQQGAAGGKQGAH